MESPGKDLLKLLVERDPASPQFRDGVRAVLHPSPLPGNAEYLWQDVFVEQPLPWGRFLQSVVLHGATLALIWMASLSWIRQQKILDRARLTGRRWSPIRRKNTYRPSTRAQ